MKKEFIYHRLVAKLGTGLLTGNSDHLDLETMAKLVGQIARLHQQGLEIIVVSSGAIAAGRDKLKFAKGGKNVPLRQVLASVGQSHLMNAYEQLFRWHDITIAQALLTKADISRRPSYLNARNTLLALLELRVIPIVNENDVVATEEIKETQFGDNDNLSALVANLVDADLLMLLGEVPGLYTADPHFDPEAKLIPRVEKIDQHIFELAQGSVGYQGIGGMKTKMEAAKLATDSGIAVAIANGHESEAITRLALGESIGTFFPPVTTKLESRKRWMLSGLASKGKLAVDTGAAKAIKEQNKSLLPAGIKELIGDFESGDVVEIIDLQGNRLAQGITNYSSTDVAIIKGCRSAQIASLLGYEYGAEVVHRNNMVVL